MISLCLAVVLRRLQVIKDRQRAERPAPLGIGELEAGAAGDEPVWLVPERVPDNYPRAYPPRGGLLWHLLLAYIAGV